MRLQTWFWDSLSLLKANNSLFLTPTVKFQRAKWMILFSGLASRLNANSSCVYLPGGIPLQIKTNVKWLPFLICKYWVRVKALRTWERRCERRRHIPLLDSHNNHPRFCVGFIFSVHLALKSLIFAFIVLDSLLSFTSTETASSFLQLV